MKRFIRCVCLVLVVACLTTNLAFAAENVEPRASNFFWCSSVYLYQRSDRTFEVWFDVSAVHTMDELGASVIKVQRSADGENWTTMKTYTKESYSQMIRSNTQYHADCVTYTGTEGYYYRAYIELYAKDSSGTGYMDRYTSSLLL